MNWQADAAAGTKIKADRHDQEDDNLASGLGNVICKDGQSSPTADISWNGKKLINLGAPVNPTDAVTKGYVDAIRTFSTGIILSGAGNNTRLEYPQADMSFLVRSPGDPAVGDTTARFIWNDKADATGNNMMTLHDNGSLDLLLKDDGAGVGPSFTLTRDSASPAVGDYLGNIDWIGKDSAAEGHTHARLYCYVEDPTHLSIDAGIGIQAVAGGGFTERVYFGVASTTIFQNLITQGYLKATGWLARAGTSGAYGTSQTNMNWTGTGVDLWLDATNLGKITTVSDYRIKKDVADLSSTWEQVKALRPISYTQAEFTPFEANDEPQWGFIAHETQETLVASAASGVKDMEDGVQALNWSPIVAALTKALQEAMARIEALEAAR